MTDPTIEALIAAAAEAGENRQANEYLLSDPEPSHSAHAAEKLRDALVAGFEPEFSPHEAEAAGALLEDALSEEDAREAGLALLWFKADALPPKA
jgi:hypothetical protein